MDFSLTEEQVAIYETAQAFGADNAKYKGRACWLVGDKGLLGCGTHAGPPMIAPTEVRENWKANLPEETIATVKGGPFREWLAACKGGPEPGSNFEAVFFDFGGTLFSYAHAFSRQGRNPYGTGIKSVRTVPNYRRRTRALSNGAGRAQRPPRQGQRRGASA